jgi:hypothetical protein
MPWTRQGGEQQLRPVRTATSGVVRDANERPPIIVLAPGHAASALVETTDNPQGTATSCPVITALFITPPHSVGSTIIRSKLTVECSHLSVHPVVEGTSGREND